MSSGPSNAVEPSVPTVAVESCKTYSAPVSQQAETAASYADATKLVQERQGREILEIVQQFLGESSFHRVLDFGCGTGALLKPILDMVGEKPLIVGVDPDGARLKIAREALQSNCLTLVEANDENVRAKVEEALLPVIKQNITSAMDSHSIDGLFDVILLNFVLHWIPNDRRATLFSAFRKMLRPGGLLVIQGPEYLSEPHKSSTLAMEGSTPDEVADVEARKKVIPTIFTR